MSIERTKRRKESGGKRTSVAWLAGLIGLVVALGTAPAAAQSEDDDKARFAALMKEAKEARDAGRHGDALGALLKAYNIYPDPTLLFNIAKLSQDQGDCDNVMNYFQRSHELAQTSGISKEKIAASLDRELGGFVCAGDASKTIPLLRQGLKVIPSEQGWLHLAELTTEAGQCTEARNAYLKAAEVGKEGGDVSNKAIAALQDFKCVEAVAVVPPEETGGSNNDKQGLGVGATSPTPEPPLSTLQWAGVGAMGLGAALFAGAVIVDVGNLSTIDDYREAAKTPDGDYMSLKDDVESAQSTALILYVASGVLAAGGAGLYLFAPADDAAAAANTWRLSPQIGVDRVGATLSFPLN